MKIYLVERIQGEYEELSITPLIAFKNKADADEYAVQALKLVQKAYIFYDTLADTVKGDETIMTLNEEEYNLYDIYSTKREQFYDVRFNVAEIPFVKIWQRWNKSVK